MNSSPHRKARMVSIAQEMELTFSQISKVLLREKRGFSIACIRLLPLGNCEQGMYLGTKVPDQHLRAVVWSRLTPEGEEGVIEEEAGTWPLPSHSALHLHSSPSFSEPPILPSHPVRQRHLSSFNSFHLELTILALMMVYVSRRIQIKTSKRI